MNIETLREEFNALFIDTNNESHLKCCLSIVGNDAVNINVFQKALGGKIFFCIEGDCVVEFDDMETNDLINILDNLKRGNNDINCQPDK